MADVTITHADGSTDTIPGTTAPSGNEPNYTRQRELLSMRRVRINVYREDAQNANLEPKSDRVDFEGDTLRLVDIDKGGSVWRLTCYSYEWDANRTPPTVGGSVYEGTDKDIITDLINDVPNWTVGSIAELTGPLSFVFSHAHIHDAIRRVEKNVPGELLFRDGGTVDYVDRIGSDKSGSVELSGTAGTIEGEIEINDKGREMDGTHIRVLGVHEGEAQLFVNLVPQGDPQTYENEVRYNAGTRWQDSSDTDWDSFENKDVTSQATLEREAETLADELADGNIEAKATTPDLNIDLGDTVQVVKPDAEIDRPMRIHRIKEIVSGATKQLKLLLSTRTRMRTGDADNLRSIRQFNKGFQGSSVAVNGGPVIGAVNSANPLTFGFRYPDLEFENAATLRVRGESYRVDSQGGAATTPTHTHPIDINQTSEAVDPQNEQLYNDFSGGNTVSNVSIGDTVTLDTFTFDENARPVYVTTGIANTNSTSYAGQFRLNINNSGGATFNGGVQEYPVNQSETAFAVTWSAQDTDTIDLEFNLTDTGDGSDVDITLVTAQAYGPPAHIHRIDAETDTNEGAGIHTHPVNPGIFETNDTPSNVGVEIGGTTTATGIGSGIFETTVDIGDELTKEAWNDITITSDSLGRVQATVFLEGYSQIGQQ